MLYDGRQSSNRCLIGNLLFFSVLSNDNMMFIVWVEGTYFTVELIYSDNSPALIILHVLILSFFQCIFLYIYHSTMRLHDVQALGRGKLPFSWFSFDLNSTFSFWLRRQGTDHIPFTSLAHTPTPTIPPRPSTMHTKI